MPFIPRPDVHKFGSLLSFEGQSDRSFMILPSLHAAFLCLMYRLSRIKAIQAYDEEEKRQMSLFFVLSFCLKMAVLLFEGPLWQADPLVICVLSCYLYHCPTACLLFLKSCPCFQFKIVKRKPCVSKTANTVPDVTTQNASITH